MMKKTRSGELDRISCLPDDVLIHILSFMSTKEAVRTSVLSKSWRNIWAAVPDLKLDVYEFWIEGPGDGSNDDEKRRNSMRRFERFVNGVLDNREQRSLGIVDYDCRIEGHGPHAPVAWLDRVACLNPQEMNISIDDWSSRRTFLYLPDSIYSCASLTKMVMTSSIPDGHLRSFDALSFNLPSLTYLRLSGLKLKADFTKKLFMGCPSLEILRIRECSLYFSSISSNVLKNLTICGCRQFEQTEISCPALVDLEIHFEIFRGISLKNMASLENATIQLNQHTEIFDADDVPVINFLDSISNITNLYLSVDSPELKEYIKKDIPNCKRFNNLKNVTFEIWESNFDFYLIKCLLKHSPNLEKLTFDLEEVLVPLKVTRSVIPLFYPLGESMGEPKGEVIRNASYQFEYLHTLKIHRRGWPNVASELIKTLGTYVKKIGNIVLK